MRALTDDLVRVWRAPSGDDPAEWEALYARIATFKVDYDRLTNPIGIYRHPGKSALVLPPRAPSHSQPTLTTATGTTIAGRPFGTPDYVQGGLEKRLAFATSRITAVLTLADVEPAIAAKMLILCSNKLLDYHVAVLPITLSDKITRPFDKAIGAAVTRIITPHNKDPGQCDKSRLARAALITSLHMHDGGFGLTPAVIKAPAAVLRFIIAIHDEPDLHPLSPLSPPPPTTAPVASSASPSSPTTTFLALFYHTTPPSSRLKALQQHFSPPPTVASSKP